MNQLIRIISTLVIRGGAALLSIAVTFAASRTLSEREAASFFVFMTFVTVASVNFRWGADEAIVRFVATADDRFGQATRLTVERFSNIRLWRSVSVSILPLLVGVLIGEAYSWLLVKKVDLLLGLIAAIATAKFSLHARYLHGAGHTEESLFFISVLTPLLFLIGFFGYGSVEDSTEAAVIYTSASLLCLLGSHCLINRRYPSGGHVIEGATQKLLTASGGLAIVVVSQQIFSWGAQIIVPLISEPALYNYFTVSQKIAAAVGLLMVSVNFAMSPVFARLYKSGAFGQMRLIVKLSLVAILGFSSVTSMLLFGFSSEIMRFAKVGYADGGQIFLLLLVAQLMNSVGAFFSVILSMAGHERYLMRIQVLANAVGLLFFLILSVLVGVATAVASMAAMYGMLAAILMRKTYSLLR